MRLSFSLSSIQGAVQQLYTVQCNDSEADLKALSILQCQSIPANGDESGTGCSQEVQSDLTQVLNEVVCTVAKCMVIL